MPNNIGCYSLAPNKMYHNSINYLTTKQALLTYKNDRLINLKQPLRHNICKIRYSSKWFTLCLNDHYFLQIRPT